jgi:hypothetical protein
MHASRAGSCCKTFLVQWSLVSNRIEQKVDEFFVTLGGRNMQCSTPTISLLFDVGAHA